MSKELDDLEQRANLLAENIELQEKERQYLQDITGLRAKVSELEKEVSQYCGPKKGRREKEQFKSDLLKWAGDSFRSDYTFIINQIFSLYKGKPLQVAMTILESAKQNSSYLSKKASVSNVQDYMLQLLNSLNNKIVADIVNSYGLDVAEHVFQYAIQHHYDRTGIQSTAEELSNQKSSEQHRKKKSFFGFLTFAALLSLTAVVSYRGYHYGGQRLQREKEFIATMVKSFPQSGELQGAEGRFKYDFSCRIGGDPSNSFLDKVMDGNAEIKKFDASIIDVPWQLFSSIGENCYRTAGSAVVFEKSRSDDADDEGEFNERGTFDICCENDHCSFVVKRAAEMYCPKYARVK